jgi:hypothetical protein
MSEELIPCPFCGAHECLVIVLQEGQDTVWAGKCENCKSYGPCGKSREEAVQFWNERRGVALLKENEEAVLSRLAEAYTLFVELPALHEWHQQEFMLAIHAAQRLVLARPALRVEFAEKLENIETAIRATKKVN